MSTLEAHRGIVERDDRQPRMSAREAATWGSLVFKALQLSQDQRWQIYHAFQLLIECIGRYSDIVNSLVPDHEPAAVLAERAESVFATQDADQLL